LRITGSICYSGDRMRSLITGLLFGILTSMTAAQFLASDLAAELRAPPPSCLPCKCTMEIVGPMSYDTSVSCRPVPDFGRPMHEENIWINNHWARCWR